MWLKFVLTVTVLLVLSESHGGLSAQGLSPQRARELYIDVQNTENCPNCNHQIPRANCYGWRGQPYYERMDEVCSCEHKRGLSFKNLSVHWPSPFSVYVDHSCFGDVCRTSSNTMVPRFRDCLDRLANIRLLPPVRRDSGYCGPDCDPYGLLGESRRATVVVIDSPEVAPGFPPHQATRRPVDSSNRSARTPPAWKMSTLDGSSRSARSTFLDRPTELRSSRSLPSVRR